MKNLNEIVFIIRDLKDEYAEAVERGMKLTGKAKEMNERHRNNIINEILRYESVVKEYHETKARETIDATQIETVFDVVEEDKPLRQDTIVKSFKKELKRILNEYENTSNKAVSENQRQTILSGFRDRIGLEVDQELMGFVNRFNFNQASELIKIMRGISFYNQRVLVTNAVKTLKHREDYEVLLAETCKFIHKREWFEVNKDIFALANELQAPTEAQVRRIANVSKYPETAMALKDYGIDVMDYEHRVVKDGEEKMYYTMNWELLKKDIEAKFNRESASNFIQTYDYITNFYEGRNLDTQQRNHLRQLYIQLGEMDKTRPSHLNTILKEQYEIISARLEEAVRLEKAIRNTSKSKVREAMLNDKTRTMRVARETRSAVVKEEQEMARDFTSFVFNIYAVIGQEVPDEARDILPYFIAGGEIKYALVEEQHYGAFRKLVFEQRDVIKQVNPNFNWGAYLFNQPTHILVALGLDMMI